MTLKSFKSWLGLTLLVAYLIGSAIIIFSVYGCTKPELWGCDFSLVLVLLPIYPLLKLQQMAGFQMAVPQFQAPGPHALDLALMALYLLIAAVLIYLAGLLLAWLFTLLVRAVRHIASPG